MKKTFKRLGAVLLAAFMLLSTTICALAAEPSADESTTSDTITLNVSGISVGDTVYAYKLVSYNKPDSNSYTFFDGDGTKKGFKTYIEKQTDIGDKTAEQYLASLKAADVNKLLEGYATECNKTTGSEYKLPEASAHGTANSGNTASLELDAGYYLLLTETTGTNSYIYTPLSAFVKADGENLVVYAGASNTALPKQGDESYTVSAKYTNGPTIDKRTNATKGSEDATWRQNAVAGVGDTVRFYVKVNIPKYADGTTLNLKVNDTLTNLEYTPNSARVYSEEPKLSSTGVTTDNSKIISDAIKNTDTIIAEAYNSETGTQKLTFELDHAAIMKNAAEAKSVYVYYEAIVKPEAVKNVMHDGKLEGTHEGTNVASLTYSNASTLGSAHETDKVTTKVFNYYLKLNKVKNDTEEALKGAKFSVYTQAKDGELLKFEQVTDTNDTKYYRPAANGNVTQLEANFQIRGLDASTYYLEEVETPKGYTKPKGRFKIVMTPQSVSDEYTGKLDSDKTKTFMEAVNPDDKNLVYAGSGADSDPMHQFSATIKNFSTPNLPTTGGTGTVLLSIGGVVLMAAGAYLLFFRKKKEN